MKKIILILAVAFTSIYANAQSKKVALIHAGATSLFLGNSAFVQAMAAASHGDTIYIPGGYWDPANIDKRVAVFGAGHYPDSTLATDATHITSSFGIYPGSDSAFLQGLDVNGEINFSSGPTSYVTINRCSFTNSTMGAATNHVTYSENVVKGILNPNNQADFLNISNNFIVNYVANITQGALIENNIFNFQWGGAWYVPYNLHAVNGSLVRNNIFMEPSAGGITNGSNNLFQNNLFVMNPTFTNNTATGSFVNISPTAVFTSYTGIGTFFYTDNYHLQTPASYLGTDGSQVGLYGGINPYKQASVPGNPHIQTSVISQTTDVNNNLNINISVGAQSH